MPTFAERSRPLEQAPRRALAWGAGLLILGLAAVGVGQPDEGAVLALGGLVVVIYGIHRFGRLGPDEPPQEPERERVGAGAAPLEAMRMGGLGLTVGLVVLVASYFDPGSSGSTGPGRHSILAWGAVLGGAAWLANGYLELQKVRQAQAKVEKRRRLDKSRAP